MITKQYTFESSHSEVINVKNINCPSAIAVDCTRYPHAYSKAHEGMT